MAVLLPSMQLGTLYKTEPDGKQIFVNADGTKLLCPHGECSSTIAHWINMEAKAKQQGLPPPPRGGSRGLSSCNCQDTLGLNPKCIGCVPTPQTALPASLFELLEQTGAERICVKGQEALRVPHLPGPTFVTARGRLCCRHGASRASLKKSEKATHDSNRLPKCGCVLGALPARSNGIKQKLPLGKFHKSRVVLACEQLSAA